MISVRSTSSMAARTSGSSDSMSSPSVGASAGRAPGTCAAIRANLPRHQIAGAATPFPRHPLATAVRLPAARELTQLADNLSCDGTAMTKRSSSWTATRRAEEKPRSISTWVSVRVRRREGSASGSWVGNRRSCPRHGPLQSRDAERKYLAGWKKAQSRPVGKLWNSNRWCERGRPEREAPVRCQGERAARAVSTSRSHHALAHDVVVRMP